MLIPNDLSGGKVDGISWYQEVLIKYIFFDKNKYSTKYTSASTATVKQPVKKYLAVPNKTPHFYRNYKSKRHLTINFTVYVYIQLRTE